MCMLPIDSRLKMLIECGFLMVLCIYALRSFILKVHHVSAGIAVLLSCPILIDILWFQCMRSPQMWAALNVPFLVVVGGFCYERIFKKGLCKLRRKLALLVTLLFGG